LEVFLDQGLMPYPPWYQSGSYQCCHVASNFDLDVFPQTKEFDAKNKNIKNK
jgi:hypothetical protein